MAVTSTAVPFRVAGCSAGIKATPWLHVQYFSNWSCLLLQYTFQAFHENHSFWPRWRMRFLFCNFHWRFNGLEVRKSHLVFLVGAVWSRLPSAEKKMRGNFSDHTHVSRWSPSHGELICTESPWSKSGPFRRQDWPGGKNGGWGDRRCLDQLSSRRLSLPGPPSKEGKSLILGKSRWVKY